MAREPKALRTVEAPRDFADLRGWKVPKGTTLHVMKTGPLHPSGDYRVLVVRVDNGTGILSLMPETVIRDSDLRGAST